MRISLSVLLFFLAALSARASFTLHWQNNDASGTVTSIAIERSKGAGAFKQIATVSPTVTSYQDTSITGGVVTTDNGTAVFHYRVRAFTASGQFSAYSNVATFHPAKLKPR
jgi:hypothetical protein